MSWTFDCGQCCRAASLQRVSQVINRMLYTAAHIGGTLYSFRGNLNFLTVVLKWSKPRGVFTSYKWQRLKRPAMCKLHTLSFYSLFRLVPCYLFISCGFRYSSFNSTVYAIS